MSSSQVTDEYSISIDVCITAEPYIDSSTVTIVITMNILSTSQVTNECGVPTDAYITVLTYIDFSTITTTMYVV